MIFHDDWIETLNILTPAMENGWHGKPATSINTGRKEETK